jgi:hypothetical protein
MERLEWRNNNNVVTFGVTSAADDYDATAEHWWHLGLRNTAAFASSSDLSWLAMLDRAGMAVYGI